jgi:hypothetical protein
MVTVALFFGVSRLEDRQHMDGIFVKRSAADLIYGYQV